jgi:hypothetical protein
MAARDGVGSRASKGSSTSSRILFHGCWTRATRVRARGRREAISQEVEVRFEAAEARLRCVEQQQRRGVVLTKAAAKDGEEAAFLPLLSFSFSFFLKLDRGGRRFVSRLCTVCYGHGEKQGKRLDVGGLPKVRIEVSKREKSKAEEGRFDERREAC